MSNYIDGNLERFTTQREELGKTDMNPMIEGYRGGKLVVVAMMTECNRDHALKSAHFLITGMDLEAIVIAFDAHYTKSPINPNTGEEWGPGEMQDACDNHDGCKIGIITDCISILEIHRDGRVSQAVLPYHVDEQERVHWSTDKSIMDTTRDKAEFTGLIPDNIHASFDIDPLDMTMGAVMGLSPMEARTHADCAVTKMLLREEICIVMLPASSEEQAALIQRSFADFTTDSIRN